MTIQIQAIEHYFPVVLFTMLYVVLNFESMDKILQRDHSNESFLALATFLWCMLLLPYYREIDACVYYRQWN